MSRGRAFAKINLALVVGPRRSRRQARSGHRAAANRPPRRDRGRAERTLSSSTVSPKTRLSAKPFSRLPTSPASARAGAFGSRSGSRSPQDSAVGAATPRLPCGLQTPLWMRPARPTSSIASPRGSVLMSRSSCTAARSSRRATVRNSRRSSCRPATGSCSSCPMATRRSRPARSTPHSTSVAEPTASSSAPTACDWRSRRRGLLGIWQGFPANDLASSSLSRELMAAGAFRADVSGAGPTVYGLFESATDADSAAASLQRAGRTLVTRPLDADDLPRLAR